MYKTNSKFSKMVSDSLSEPLLVHEPKERGVQIIRAHDAGEIILSKTEPDLITVQEQQEIIPITMYTFLDNIDLNPKYLEVFGPPQFKKRANSYSRLTKYRHNKVRRRAGFHK